MSLQASSVCTSSYPGSLSMSKSMSNDHPKCDHCVIAGAVICCMQGGYDQPVPQMAPKVVSPAPFLERVYNLKGKWFRSVGGGLGKLEVVWVS